MTDVRDGGGHRGSRTGAEMDDLLTRWGSEQSGPFRRPALPGGRHAASDPDLSGRPVAGPPEPPAPRSRYRPDDVPPAWDRPAGPAAAPNGRRPAPPPADPYRPVPLLTPRPADPGPYAGWRSADAPAPVGVLDRVPGSGPRRVRDRYGLLTHEAGADPWDTPDEWDDETPGRHRRPGSRTGLRPRWLRSLRWVGLAVAALLLVGGGIGVYQYRKLSGNIKRADVLAPNDASIRDAAKQLDAENYLLIGSDTRAGANSRYEENAGQVSGERSDTTILAHLSPNRDKATMVSFPRDSWVSLPECRKADGTVEPAHDGQFNEAFSIGGPSCTVLAVQRLTGIKINHYVQVDFNGFKTMVDAVGGVPICTPTSLYDKESGLRMSPGTTRLAGEQALSYVRARYGLGDGSDLGRIQRQQRFLGAMVRAARSTKLLVNPVALTKFLGAATKSLTLDKETSFGDLKSLADQLNGLDPKKVGFLTAPIANPAYNPPGFPALKPGQGGSKVLLDDEAGRTLWDSIINDKPAQPGRTTPAPKKDVLTVAPAEVTVRVLNGVGTGGLGKTVSSALAGVGFTVAEPSNAPRTTTTTVRYAPDQAAQARTLAAAVPGAVLQPDSGTTLDLVVGANYTAVKLVRPGDPATAKAAATPRPTAAKPAAKPVTAADTTCT